MKTTQLPLAPTLFLFSTLALNAQWTNLGGGITNPWRSMGGLFPVDENVIWGFTWSTLSFTPTHDFTRTTDGGQSWHPGALGVPDDHFPIYLYALDGQTAWLATADEQTPISGHIYKTTDGGGSWERQPTGFTGFNETPAGIWFWNENEGFAYGAACDGSNNDQIAVYTTADGGESWMKAPADNMPAQLPGEGMCIWNLTGFFSVVGDTVWFGTSKARVFRSTDRGHSWEAFSTPLPADSSVSSITFKDSQNGLALSFSPFRIARTTDGGQTWALVPGNYPSNYIGAQVEYIPGTRGTWLIVPAPFKYLLSYDDGEHWETFDSNIDIWPVEFLNATTGFAGSYTSGSQPRPVIYKWAGEPLGNRWFVNDDAAGANNGQKWEDAFNSLQDAIAAAEEGDEIWVAEGTYLPGMPGGDPASTFLIEKHLQLYGGFAGTEATLADRNDPADHPTILSGDLNGDDVEGDFEANRGDNVRTVVTANDSAQAVIDGFTISHGHAGSDMEDETGRGGGLHSRLNTPGVLMVRNCLFTQNFAGLQGGGMFAQNLDTGGEDPLVVENCQFVGNSSARGGGLYCSQEGSNSSIAVRNCQFAENVAIESGGGFRYFTSETSSSSFLEIDGCTFSQNSAGTSFNGSGFRATLRGTGSDLVLKNSSFVENSGSLFGAAAIWGIDSAASGNVEVFDCLFERNSSTYVAGLGVGSLEGANYFTYTVTNCHFLNNQASSLGGGMEAYGESPALVTVEGCTFEGNTAGMAGGGMIVNTSHPDFEAVVKNCIFKNNSSPGGAAVNASNFTDNTGMTLEADITFDNCLMTGNIGAESLINLSNVGELKLLNCTLAENEANGIVLIQQGDLSLQNTVLYNPGFTEYLGSFESTFTSNGGNLVRDNSLEGLLTARDKPETEPGFTPGAFEPSSTSPLVNAGVNEGVTALYDLAGNDRIRHGTVDIGAYESDFISGVKEGIAGTVEIYPNPVTDVLYLQFPVGATLPFKANLYDAQGKLVQTTLITRGQAVGVEGLAAGLYLVKAMAGGKIYTGKFSKL